jgi:hypothetical protein
MDFMELGIDRASDSGGGMGDTFWQESGGVSVSPGSRYRLVSGPSLKG